MMTILIILYFLVFLPFFSIGMEEVISVFPSHPGKYSVQTTRSWEFVGLNKIEGQSSWNKFKMGGDDLLSKAKHGKHVIIGVMDSGKVIIKLLIQIPLSQYLVFM